MGWDVFFILAKKTLARVFLLVTSDVVTDQRVKRSASAIAEQGHTVCVLGRSIRSTPPLFKYSYGVHLFRLPFQKGMFFYLSYNLWATFWLLFKRVDIVYANDLDTLLAAGLISVVKRKPLIYDSHELFTELPELVTRKFKQRLWYWLEKFMLKQVDVGIAVSDSVAVELKKRYKKEFVVVRNVPKSKVNVDVVKSTEKIIIYQGALNIGRGLEKLIFAMQNVTDAKLLIAGSGDIEGQLIGLTNQLGLDGKVQFVGRLSPEALSLLTSRATIGVSLEEDMGLNYRCALPNKLFDYLHAGLPVLVSDMPEMKSIVDSYNVGRTLKRNASSDRLAECLMAMINDQKQMSLWKQNAKKAAVELCWDNEKWLFLAAISKVF